MNEPEAPRESEAPDTITASDAAQPVETDHAGTEHAETERAEVGRAGASRTESERAEMLAQYIPLPRSPLPGS